MVRKIINENQTFRNYFGSNFGTNESFHYKTNDNEEKANDETCIKCFQNCKLDVSFDHLKCVNLCYLDFQKFCSDSFDLFSNLDLLRLDQPRNCAHINFERLENLNTLVIYGISSFEILTKFNPNLVELFVYDYSIENYSNQTKLIEAIKRFAHLESLSLCEFTMENFEFLFECECARSLTFLNMSKTHFSRFNPKTPLNLPNLESLNLSSCSIKSIDREMFCHLVNLKTLSLSENEIATLDDNVFADLKTLQILDLAKNQIKKVSEATFADLESLKKLDLSGNPLDAIDPNMLAKLTNLRFVNLNSSNSVNREQLEKAYKYRIYFSFN